MNIPFNLGDQVSYDVLPGQLTIKAIVKNLRIVSNGSVNYLISPLEGQGVKWVPSIALKRPSLEVA